MTTAVVRRLSSSAMSNRGLESASTHHTDIGNTMHDAKSTIVAERFKTRLCQKFEQTHACPYDTRCMFAHGSADLRTKEQNIRDDLVTEEAVKAFLKARALVAHAAAKKKERQRRRQKKKQEAKATSLANSVVSTRSPGDQRQLLRRDFDDDDASSDSSLCSAAQDDVADGDDAVAGSPTQARRNRFKSALTASSNRQQPPPAPLTLTFVRGPNGTTAFANQQLPPSLSSVSVSIEDAALRSGVFAASAQSAAIEAVCLERSGTGWTTSPAGAAHHHQQPHHHGSHRTTAPLRHHHHNGGQQYQHHRPELTAETPSTTYCAAASHQSPETASSAYDPSTPLIGIPTTRRSGPAAGGSGATTAPWILSASVQTSPAVRVGGLPVPLPTTAVTSPPAQQQAMMMTMPRAACDTAAFRIHESYVTDQGYGLVPTQPPAPATPAPRTTHYRHDPYSVTRRTVRGGGYQQHQPYPAASSRRQSGDDDDDGMALLRRSSSRTSASGQHTDSSVPTSASSSSVGVPAGCVPCLPRKPSTPLVDEECE